MTDDRRCLAVELRAKEVHGEGDAEKVECVTGPSQPACGQGFNLSLVKQRGGRAYPDQNWAHWTNVRLVRAGMTPAFSDFSLRGMRLRMKYGAGMGKRKSGSLADQNIWLSGRV